MLVELTVSAGTTAVDPPRYADPIVIRFTGRMGAPRRRPSGGRWDLGPSRHPGFTDPSWFKRTDPASPAMLAQLAVPFQPLVPPAASPAGPPDDRLAPGSGEAAARARRRADYVRHEIVAGDPGRAAGLLLGYLSYPPEVDDPPLAILHNEAPAAGRSELDQAVDAAKADFGKRRADALDEPHLQAAEADRRGEPVVRESDGHVYDHEKEVADSTRGLENTLAKLEKKLVHERDYANPEADEQAVKHAESVIKEIGDFLSEIERRLSKLSAR